MRISVQDRSLGPQFLDSQDATYEWQWQRNTADATPVALVPRSNVNLEPNTVYAFEGLVVARYAGASTGGAYRVQGAVKMGAAAANTALVGTPLVTSYEDTAGMDLGVTADTSNGRITLTATGVSATSINWIAKLRFVKVGATL
jgi:hypothetical protein